MLHFQKTVQGVWVIWDGDVIEGKGRNRGYYFEKKI